MTTMLSEWLADLVNLAQVAVAVAVLGMFVFAVLAALSFVWRGER